MCYVCDGGIVKFARALNSRRQVLRLGGAFAATSALGLQACTTATESRSSAAAPDTILIGGTIHTMSAALPRAEALAITNGRISAVGAAREIERLRGASTQIVDMRGKTVLPGFVDPHMHFAAVELDDFVDASVRRAPTIAALQGLICGLAAQSPPTQWVRAQQFDPTIVRDRRGPTLAELDAAAPDHPVFVIETNGHVAYVNSRALQIAGVVNTMPDPSAGRFVRDASGALTGRLEEAPAMYPFLARMPVVSEAELTVRAMTLARRAAAAGCTMLHDCAIGALRGASELERLRTISEQGAPVRLRGMLVAAASQRWESLGLRPGMGDDRMRLTGMKTLSDGSNQARTSFMREPYLGTAARGAANLSLEQLTETIRRAHRSGWQMGVHANGDAAIDLTLAAYRAVLEESPRADHRHRIEHCSMLHPEQMATMRELGVSPSFLIGHVRIWGKAFQERLIGPERIRHYDPCRSALAAGLRISLHSDYSVTPLEPLQAVETAVTRAMDEGGEALNPSEGLTVAQALKAVTLDAAWQVGADDITGSIESGKYADLVVLAEDPFRVRPNEIANIPVRDTWLAGVPLDAG
jgi:predicted amidohydrolase YtcJ